ILAQSSPRKSSTPSAAVLSSPRPNAPPNPAPALVKSPTPSATPPACSPPRNSTISPSPISYWQTKSHCSTTPMSPSTALNPLPQSQRNPPRRRSFRASSPSGKPCSSAPSAASPPRASSPEASTYDAAPIASPNGSTPSAPRPPRPPVT